MGDQKIEGEQIWGMYSSGGPTAELWAGSDCVIPRPELCLGGLLRHSVCKLP